MATITWGNYKDRIARLSHKNLNRSVQESDVEQWGKAGIEAVEMAEAWEYLREPYAISLVAGQYRYAYPDNNELSEFAPLERIDEMSLRYGAKITQYIGWVARPEMIDRNANFGPGWRDAAGATGTIELATQGRNRELWVAKKPSTEFVADFPTLYAYGWTSDLHTIGAGSTTDSTVLRIPVWAAQCYVNAAMATGLQQEDDPDWQRFRQLHRDDLQRLRARPGSVTAHKEIQMPRSFKLRRRII